jgi:protein-S-isoprenylcysteine O-methyltransferase Ste14
MATSRSTARLKLTLVLLLLLVGLVAFSRRDLLDATAGALMQLAGLACVVLAALGRIWASVFIAGFKDVRLVRAGPYSVCRHPLYGLSMLGMLGLGLATRSFVLAIALLVIFAVLYALAIRAEDRHLASLHGEAFDAFRREVPALWPNGPGNALPAEYEIRPPILRKAFVDAGSLFGAYLLICLADLLQVSGLLPSLLALS